MGDAVKASAVIHADQHDKTKTPTKNEGTLKAEGKEHTLLPFGDTESVSQGVSEFLGEINEPKELPETFLSEYTFTEITNETIEIETTIMEMSQELEEMVEADKSAPRSEVKSDEQANKKPLEGEPKQQATQGEQPKIVYSSLFSLAQSFNKGLAKGHQQPQTEAGKERKQTREERRPNQPLAFSTSEPLNGSMIESRSDHHDQEQDRDQKQDEEQKEGFGGHQDQREQQEQRKRKEIFNIKASRSVSKTHSTHRVSSAHQSVRGVENIFIRFMALMARILGQAEAEAHALYTKIKERTDNIDTLTHLISKINCEKGKIDWSNNEEMKQLIEKARAIGVEIPEGKYKWSENEKKLLKENIQLRKDSMEKVTQLERTDMQRYLQEASQCHQARSNVLKLLKEVTDTIIHNMRGG